MEQLQITVCTDKGQVRPTNEDYSASYIPPDQEVRERLGSLFIVADGVGGRRAGEVASAEAVSVLQQEYYFGPWSLDPAKRLEQATRRANMHVFEMANALISFRTMACTMTALLLCRGRYYVSHVGDTRCYLVRAGQIKKLTSDHSVSGEMRRFGLLTRQQAAEHSSRSFLTRSIGVGMAVRPDLLSGGYQAGDYFALTSDGFTEYIQREELRDALLSGSDVEATARELIAEANRRGGGDNMTLMVIYVAG